MLTQLPKTLPPLSILIADLGHPRPAAIAKALDVSEPTVRRWLRCDSAPRSVLLSLFWLTRWGRSQVDCQAVNDARVHVGLSRALAAENSNLRRRMAKVARLADFGSANDPGDFFASEKPGSMAYATEPASCFSPSGNDPYPRGRTSIARAHLR